jgi:hypothetical protein
MLRTAAIMEANDTTSTTIKKHVAIIVATPKHNQDAQVCSPSQTTETHAADSYVPSTKNGDLIVYVSGALPNYQCKLSDVIASDTVEIRR